MRQNGFEGVFPAIITPFDQEGNVEFEYLKDVIRFHLEKGVHGFFPCGSAGEGPLMSIEQRKTVAEAVVNEVSDRVPVIIHAGTTNTQETVELAKHAEKIGGSAVGVISPYYFKPDTDGLIEHYSLIAKAINIPVLIYNIPYFTGFNMTPDVITRLCDIKNVIGVKDSSGNLGQIKDIIDKAAKPITVINGSDRIFFASLMIGVQSQISGMANVVPELFVTLYESYKSGEYQKALNLQTKINAVSRAMEGPPMASLKAALELRGIKAGFPKRPLRPLRTEEISKLKERLRSLNLFW